MSVDHTAEIKTEITTTASWQTYFALCKPKVVALIVFTALVGMLLVETSLPSWRILLFGLSGIGLAAASGAAINHWVDRRIDRIMARTSGRPLPKGEIPPHHALVFAIGIGVVGLTMLLIEINLLTTVLTALSLIGYAVIYTMYLKHSTPYNIVLGGAAGATPPLLGWVAVTGQVGIEALLLFSIVLVWTPPHFWALAIKRREEYAKAGVPMLPVTHGVDFTKKQIVLYVIALIGITILPAIIGMNGLAYLAGALVLGARFLWHAARLYHSGSDIHAMPTFAYSIKYLMLLFGLMLLDHYGAGIWAHYLG